MGGLIIAAWQSKFHLPRRRPNVIVTDWFFSARRGFRNLRKSHRMSVSEMAIPGYAWAPCVSCIAPRWPIAMLAAPLGSSAKAAVISLKCGHEQFLLLSALIAHG